MSKALKLGAQLRRELGEHKIRLSYTCGELAAVTDDRDEYRVQLAKAEAEIKQLREDFNILIKHQGVHYLTVDHAMICVANSVHRYGRIEGEGEGR